MSSSCDTAFILRQIICSIPESVVNGDWRKVFYNGITGNDRAARAEPSWLEFCRVVKEEDESQINGITEIEFRAICALAFSVSSVQPLVSNKNLSLQQNPRFPSSWRGQGWLPLSLFVSLSSVIRFRSERNYHNYHNYPRNTILTFYLTQNQQSSECHQACLNGWDAMEENNSQITDIFSVFLFYFRFFRYKKYPRANHFENQIWLLSSSSSLDKDYTSITLFSLVRRFRYFCHFCGT